jgi:hypothetical protein
VAHHFVTSLQATDTGLVFADSLKLTRGFPERFAIRAVFRPFFIQNGDQWITDTSKGWFAEIAAPEAANIGSIAVALKGQTATGVLSVSVVDPSVSYDGFFLYTFLSDILPTTSGLSMYRKTEITNGGYSTLTFTEGRIYALILDGPAVPSVSVSFGNASVDPSSLPRLLADTAIFADTV